MNFVYILIFVIGLLFALAYFTKRRFGVLGLALCAGSLISTMWTAQVTPYIQEAGLQLLSPPLSSVVAAALVLLPAIILLFSGPSYKRTWQKIIGASAFALLSTSLLLTPLGNSLSLDEMGLSYYNFLVENKSIIITAAIAYALFDLLTLKTPRRSKD
jgi:hypothetical protein